MQNRMRSISHRCKRQIEILRKPYTGFLETRDFADGNPGLSEQAQRNFLSSDDVKTKRHDFPGNVSRFHHRANHESLHGSIRLVP